MKDKSLEARLKILNQKNPEIERIKKEILNLPGIKKGLIKEEILKALKNSKEDKIMLALMALLNRGELAGSAAVYYSNLGEIVVHTFRSNKDKTRFGGIKC